MQALALALDDPQLRRVFRAAYIVNIDPVGEFSVERS